VLLEAYIRVSEGGQNRKNAISEVSKKLRKMAENQEEIIDEIFRNNAGIIFQVQSMESAYFGHSEEIGSLSDGGRLSLEGTII
jgi:hypothetical protein